MEGNIRVTRSKVPEFYWVERLPESGAILLRDNYSYFVSKEHLINIVKGLNIAIEHYEEFELEKFNQELKENRHKEMMKSQVDNKTFKKPRNVQSGYVYFITYDNQYYKIGKAKDLKSRLKVFSVEMPGKIEIFHVVKSKDMFLTENLFHDYFKDKRLNGEWFNLNENDLDYIKTSRYTKEIANSIKGGAINE